MANLECISSFYINKNIETEIFREFFQSFTQSAGITLHIENLYGNNTHHIVESCFKSLAISMREAIKIDKQNSEKIPSTKGSQTEIINMKIVIIDYGSGNLRSVENAFKISINNNNLNFKVCN